MARATVSHQHPRTHPHPGVTVLRLQPQPNQDARRLDQRMSEITNGNLARLERAIADIEKLDAEKADAKDVQALAKSFDSLRTTLQWFMGIMASIAIAAAVVIVQLAGG